MREFDLERWERTATLLWGTPPRGPRPGRSRGDHPSVPSQAPCASTPGLQDGQSPRHGPSGDSADRLCRECAALETAVLACILPPRASRRFRL